MAQQKQQISGQTCWDSDGGLPDGVEDVHGEGASLHGQDPTRVLVGVAGLVQVEEVVEFLQIKKKEGER